MSDQAWWVVLVVASIPAVASIVAAVIAGSFARAAKQSELHAQRLRDLEERISERKYEVYKPMINLLRDMLSSSGGKHVSEKHVQEKLGEFATWIVIYGSDDAVISFSNFMQAAYSSAPGPIMLRLYGDFLLAVRRDMSYKDTAVQRRQILGMRITDVYNTPDLSGPSFEEACKRHGWRPPWQSASHAGL